jgi:hypothetical protein
MDPQVENDGEQWTALTLTYMLLPYPDPSICLGNGQIGHYAGEMGRLADGNMEK